MIANASWTQAPLLSKDLSSFLLPATLRDRQSPACLFTGEETEPPRCRVTGPGTRVVRWRSWDPNQAIRGLTLGLNYDVLPHKTKQDKKTTLEFSRRKKKIRSETKSWQFSSLEVIIVMGWLLIKARSDDFWMLTWSQLLFMSFIWLSPSSPDTGKGSALLLPPFMPEKTREQSSA